MEAFPPFYYGKALIGFYFIFSTACSGDDNLSIICEYGASLHFVYFGIVLLFFFVQGSV